jgi:hypothetical protein
MKPIWITILILVGGGLLLFGLIQLIPVDHTNPPVVTQVKWDSPQTQALFERACADCHSNETVWPAYSNVAPFSWLVARDVTEGREHFNISDLGAMDTRRRNRLPKEIGEQMREGEMPMPIYLPLHPEANLTTAEKQALVEGLLLTLANTQAGQ